MLAQLTIENFGLIDRLTVEFVGHLNILTGSTGAGKSILIDGLRFALGERLNPAAIRDPLKNCTVEAVFELNDARFLSHELIGEFIRPDQPQIIISRQYLPDGRTKIKVNGFSITISQLKNLGDQLIDFHGAHDHQLLLSEDRHIGILDQLTDFGGDMEKYRLHFDQYLHIQKQIQHLAELAGSRDRDLDLLAHQIKELEQVPLTEEAHEKISDDQIRINNAEKLYSHASSLLAILEGEDGSLSDIVRKAFVPLRGLTQVDAKAMVFEQSLNSIQESSENFLGELRDYLDRLSFEPSEAAEISRKFDIYDDIKRKYGPTLEAAAKFYEQAREKPPTSVRPSPSKSATIGFWM